MKLIGKNLSYFIKFLAAFCVLDIKEYLVLKILGVVICIRVVQKVLYQFVVEVVVLSIVERLIVQAILICHKHASEPHLRGKEIIYQFFIHLNVSVADSIPFHLVEYAVFLFNALYIFFVLLVSVFWDTNGSDAHHR